MSKENPIVLKMPGVDHYIPIERAREIIADFTCQIDEVERGGCDICGAVHRGIGPIDKLHDCRARVVKQLRDLRIVTQDFVDAADLDRSLPQFKTLVDTLNKATRGPIKAGVRVRCMRDIVGGMFGASRPLSVGEIFTVIGFGSDGFLIFREINEASRFNPTHFELVDDGVGGPR